MDNSQREREINNERIPPPQAMEVVPSSPSASASTPTTWSSGLPSVKMDAPHKGVTTTTTPDGKFSFCLIYLFSNAGIKCAVWSTE